MCGIVGIYSKDKSFNQDNVVNMLMQISNRGPDDQGIVDFNNGLILGHRRLSIIDLSHNGHQPMKDSKGKMYITYNGEIYNYKKIRGDLEKKGYKFLSNTDTEVVLYAYKEYKEKCLNKFRGFFSFCIYDLDENKLFLARDRLGQKPLVYCLDKDFFAFSSEIKSFKEIKKNISKDAIKDLLILKYIQAPKTIYNNIQKLEAGHYIEYCLNNSSLILKKYWEPKFEPKIDISYKNAKQKIHDLLVDAINLRTISDVPIGIFLSGGIDSSIIVALLREQHNDKIDTFSIGFKDQQFDERKYARKISKIFHTSHHEFLVEPNLEKDLETIVSSFDEPFADPSIIPTYYLAKEVSKYVKVALGGDGADELFGGYKRYNIHLRNGFLNYFPKILFNFNKRLIHKIPQTLYKKEKYGKISRIVESISGNLTETYYMRIGGFSPKETNLLLNEELNYQDIWENEIKNYLLKNPKMKNIDSLLAIDQLTHLPEYILKKTDILTMANSLEARAPFMDHKVIDFVNKLKTSYKSKHAISKRILKDILLEKGVPKDIIHRKKAGFTPPIKRWLLEHDSFVRKYLLENRLLFIFLNRQNIKKLYFLNKQYNGALSDKIWIILVLSIWLSNNKT